MANNTGKKYGGREAGTPNKRTKSIAEKLSVLDDIAFKKLEEGIIAGEYNFIKLFLEYSYGKPKQMIEQIIETNNRPLIIDWSSKYDEAETN